MDETLDGGGHAYEVCRRLGSRRLIGIDQDADATTAAGKRLEHFKDGVTIVRNNYENIKTVLEGLELGKVSGIYLDLGIPSYQLDKASRGFTYKEDVPLGMRMDRRNTTTTTNIVNTHGEMELYRVIRDCGKDNFAKDIAEHIVKKQEEHPIGAARQLAEIIKNAILARIRAMDGHPAKCTFQAIRIECNHELDVLEHSVDTTIDLLDPGGRLSIITFHSLEDRIIENRFRTNENPCVCPHEFPVCVCSRKSKGEVVSRKPVLPSEKELEENSRSKNARLHVSEQG